jgi:hypothetical protein
LVWNLILSWRSPLALVLWCSRLKTYNATVRYIHSCCRVQKLDAYLRILVEVELLAAAPRSLLRFLVVDTRAVGRNPASWYFLLLRL